MDARSVQCFICIGSESGRRPGAGGGFLAAVDGLGSGITWPTRLRDIVAFWARRVAYWCL